MSNIKWVTKEEALKIWPSKDEIPESQVDCIKAKETKMKDIEKVNGGSETRKKP